MKNDKLFLSSKGMYDNILIKNLPLTPQNGSNSFQNNLERKILKETSEHIIERKETDNSQLNRNKINNDDKEDMIIDYSERDKNNNSSENQKQIIVVSKNKLEKKNKAVKSSIIKVNRNESKHNLIDSTLSPVFNVSASEHKDSLSFNLSDKDIQIKRNDSRNKINLIKNNNKIGNADNNKIENIDNNKIINTGNNNKAKDSKSKNSIFSSTFNNMSKNGISQSKEDFYFNSNNNKGDNKIEINFFIKNKKYSLMDLPIDEKIISVNLIEEINKKLKRINYHNFFPNDYIFQIVNSNTSRKQSLNHTFSSQKNLLSNNKIIKSISLNTHRSIENIHSNKNINLDKETDKKFPNKNKFLENKISININKQPKKQEQKDKIKDAKILKDLVADISLVKDNNKENEIKGDKNFKENECETEKLKKIDNIQENQDTDKEKNKDDDKNNEKIPSEINKNKPQIETNNSNINLEKQTINVDSTFTNIKPEVLKNNCGNENAKIKIKNEDIKDLLNDNNSNNKVNLMKVIFPNKGNTITENNNSPKECCSTILEDNNHFEKYYENNNNMNDYLSSQNSNKKNKEGNQNNNHFIKSCIKCSKLLDTNESSSYVKNKTSNNLSEKKVVFKEENNINLYEFPKASNKKYVLSNSNKNKKKKSKSNNLQIKINNNNNNKQIKNKSNTINYTEQPLNKLKNKSNKPLISVERQNKINTLDADINVNEFNLSNEEIVNNDFYFDDKIEIERYNDYKNPENWNNIGLDKQAKKISQNELNEKLYSKEIGKKNKQSLKRVLHRGKILRSKFFGNTGT